MTTTQTPVDALTDDEAMALIQQAFGYCNPANMPPERMKLVRLVEASARAMAAIPEGFVPVCGRGRFVDEMWSNCSLEHVRMVQAAPHEWKGYMVEELYARAAPTPPTAPAQSNAVYLVATGEVYEGQETYTRHDVRPPMCDAEKLFSAVPAQDAQGVPAAAWMHVEDPRRLISAMQKEDAEKSGGASAFSVKNYTIALIHRHEAAALRASSPADTREPLTDEQIDAIPFRALDIGADASFREFARAIEAHHGIVTKEST